MRSKLQCFHFRLLCRWKPWNSLEIQSIFLNMIHFYALRAQHRSLFLECWKAIQVCWFFFLHFQITLYGKIRYKWLYQFHNWKLWILTYYNPAGTNLLIISYEHIFMHIMLAMFRLCRFFLHFSVSHKLIIKKWVFIWI